MSSIESFIEATNAEATTYGLFHHFQKIIKTYGYDRICYSLLTDHAPANLKARHALMKSYPESWMKHYTDNNYHQIDPVIQLALKSNTPFTWDFVTNNLDITKTQKNLMLEAEEAELYDGVLIPMHEINGQISGVGLASSSKGVVSDKNSRMKINAICRQFHIAYIELIKRETVTPKIKLTNREKEILLWAAEGKSDAVIADILGISYSTVRFHLNNIYKKLDTNERVFAVIKAIRLGLIIPNTIQTTPY